MNQYVQVLDTLMYPNIRIDVLLIKGRLTPGSVRLVECILEVPPNRMFIAAPSKEFPYNVADLGSVRIIMNRREVQSEPTSNLLSRTASTASLHSLPESEYFGRNSGIGAITPRERGISL